MDNLYYKVESKDLKVPFLDITFPNNGLTLEEKYNLLSDVIFEAKRMVYFLNVNQEKDELETVIKPSYLSIKDEYENILYEVIPKPLTVKEILKQFDKLV